AADSSVLGEPPAGLSVRAVADPGDVTVAGPMLAHLDVAEGSTLTEADAWRLITLLAPGKAREVLFTLPAADPAADQVADCRERLSAAGLSCAVAVELVADDGRAQLLLFATRDSKHLARFKDELWAVDEFAGIR